MRGALIRPGMLATAARNLECHRNTCWMAAEGWNWNSERAGKPAGSAAREICGLHCDSHSDSHCPSTKSIQTNVGRHNASGPESARTSERKLFPSSQCASDAERDVERATSRRHRAGAPIEALRPKKCAKDDLLSKLFQTAHKSAFASLN